MRDNKSPGAWLRCRLRNKAKKPPKPCTCPAGGVSTSCKVRRHADRARLLQSVGEDPARFPFTDGGSRMEIEEVKAAEFSTAHITRKDGQLLQTVTAKELRLTVASYDAGAFFHVATDADYLEETLEALAKAGFSEAFRRIYRECGEAGIAILRFDADAPVHEDFTCFDWEEQALLPVLIDLRDFTLQHVGSRCSNCKAKLFLLGSRADLGIVRVFYLCADCGLVLEPGVEAPIGLPEADRARGACDAADEGMGGTNDTDEGTAD